MHYKEVRAKTSTGWLRIKIICPSEAFKTKTTYFFFFRACILLTIFCTVWYVAFLTIGLILTTYNQKLYIYKNKYDFLKDIKLMAKLIKYLTPKCLISKDQAFLFFDI